MRVEPCVKEWVLFRNRLVESGCRSHKESIEFVGGKVEGRWFFLSVFGDEEWLFRAGADDFLNGGVVEQRSKNFLYIFGLRGRLRNSRQGCRKYLRWLRLLFL